MKKFVLACLAALIVLSVSPVFAETRTATLGPLNFDSSQQLLSFIPTIDYDTGWVPGPSPVKVKFKLFVSPGYLQSHHAVYLTASYDTNDLRPGGLLPITFNITSAGPESFIHGGAGLITEAKWKIGGGWLSISGDIPYLPNINCGFQAGAGEYDSPMPNEGYKIGAKADLGEGIEIPLYTIGSVADIYLAVKPGVMAKLGFNDLKGKLYVPQVSQVLTSTGSPLNMDQELALATSATTGQVFKDPAAERPP